MSITVDSIPTSPSFLGNKPKFRLRCSSSTAGTKARFGILLSSSFPVGKEILITIGTTTLHFKKYTSVLESSYGWTNASSLKALLQNNFYLVDKFDIVDPESGDTSASFYIVAKEAGVSGLSVSSDTTTGISILGSDGTDPAESQNYGVVLRFETSRGNTSWMRLRPRSGQVTLSSEMLRAFCPAPTLPSITGTFNPVLLPDMLSARLRFAESFGATPIVQKLYSTNNVQLFPGEMVEPMSTDGVPDWYDENPTIALAHDQLFVLRVIGESSQQIVPIARNEQSFIHLYARNNSEAANATYTISANVTRHKNDGTTSESNNTFTLTNGLLYRLDVSPAALGITEDVGAYTLSLYNQNGTLAFTRIYQVRYGLPTLHQFLLQNRYGLLEAFAALHVNRTASFEGDEVLNEGQVLMDITKREESFTAVSPMLSHQEAQRLAHSFSGKYCYYLVNGSYQRIAIEPAAVTYRDEVQNLIQLSFVYRFMKNQQENIATKNSETSSPATADGVMMTEEGYLLLTEDSDILAME